MTSTSTSRQSIRTREPRSTEWREHANRMVAYPEDYGWTRRQASRLIREMAEPAVEVWQIGCRGTPVVVGVFALGATVWALAATPLVGVLAALSWLAFVAALRSPHQLTVDREGGHFLATAVTGEEEFFSADVHELVRHETLGSGLLHHFEIVHDGGSVTVHGESEAEERFRVVRAMAPRATINCKDYDPDPD